MSENKMGRDTVIERYGLEKSWFSNSIDSVLIVSV